MVRQGKPAKTKDWVLRASGVLGAGVATLLAVTDVVAGDQSGWFDLSYDSPRDEAARHARAEAERERRVRGLEDCQRQASHLGMGSAESAPEAPSASPATPPADTEAARTFTLPIPARERGAEMSAAAFAKERADELIVAGLSSADLEIAALFGFAASAPTRLAPGREVTRLRLPGASRAEAVRELGRILPSLSVMPNEAYTIFMAPDEEPDTEARTVIERSRMMPAAPGPCPSETCFGPELIAWHGGLGACARGVRVGIIDTSFELAHPAFRNINAEQGVFLDGEQPSPYDWHGTAVLSLLAGDPSRGTPGLLPEATFLLATAFRSDAAGNASTDTVRLLAALAWLDARGADVVNMSFSGPQDLAVQHAISEMRKKGVVFIAAAGNMGPVAGPSYPAAYADVIAVTAVNRNGEGYRHANRGDYIDVAAPGVDILTALPGAQQGYRSGTSFAAPFVTAIAAARVGDRVREEVAFEGAGLALLRDLAVRDLGPPGRDPIYGAGLALAPETCAPGRDDAVADAPSVSSPVLDARARPQPATVIRAGAAGGPR